MISPIILLNTVYTIVDSYSGTKNGAFTLVTNNIVLNRFGSAAAMAWVYFLFIAIIISLVFFCSRRKG